MNVISFSYQEPILPPHIRNRSAEYRWSLWVFASEQLARGTIDEVASWEPADLQQLSFDDHVDTETLRDRHIVVRSMSDCDKLSELFVLFCELSDLSVQGINKLPIWARDFWYEMLDLDCEIEFIQAYEAVGYFRACRDFVNAYSKSVGSIWG